MVKYVRCEVVSSIGLCSIFITSIKDNWKKINKMGNSKPINDIEDLGRELATIENQFLSLYRKMLAVAMDYSSYIDPKTKGDTIYKIRDNIIHRFYAVKYHFEILVKILRTLDKELTALFRKSPSIDLFPYFEREVLHIYYLTDSIFFHLGSGFDYISNMVGFIYSTNKDKDQKWIQLAKSSRDKNNKFSRISIAQTIDILDREFVGKLYDHRSYLIHSKVDRGSRSFSINLMAAVCETHIFAPEKLSRSFRELKEESKMNNITLQYALIWIIKKSISSMVQILFALKSYMEDNKKVDVLPMFIKGPKGETLPISGPYWIDK